MVKMKPNKKDPRVVKVAMWLTKRRSIIFAPIFAAVLLAARPASSFLTEGIQIVVGILSLWAGTRLRMIASSYHRSSHGKEPITAGPYAYVRHPIYLANFLIGLGFFIIAGWWPVTVVYSAVFLVLHILLILSEETSLSKLYGAEYQIYRRTVPAIIPWKRPTGPSYGTPNEFKLKQGQERLKIVGYAAGMMALVIFKYVKAQVHPPREFFPSFSWMIFLFIALAAIVFRPKEKMQWHFLRVVQAAIVIISVLAILMQVPGVWPADNSVQRPMVLSHNLHGGE